MKPITVDIAKEIEGKRVLGLIELPHHRTGILLEGSRMLDCRGYILGRDETNRILSAAAIKEVADLHDSVTTRKEE